MSLFPGASAAVIVAIALFGTVTLVPIDAEAARMSKAEKIAVKEAQVACRAEARGKNIRLLARKKFVRTCVAKALKGHPGVNVMEMTRKHTNIKTLRGQQPSEWGCPSSC